MLVRAYVVPFQAEHAVMNENHRKIVACPTEQEADEYIKRWTEGLSALSLRG